MGPLEQIFLQPGNVLIVGGTVSLMIILTATIGSWAQTALYARLAPFLPIVIAIALAFIPRALTAGMVWGDKLLLGATLGLGAAWAYKAYRQSLLGHDDRITPQVVP